MCVRPPETEHAGAPLLKLLYFYVRSLALGVNPQPTSFSTSPPPDFTVQSPDFGGFIQEISGMENAFARINGDEERKTGHEEVGATAGLLLHSDHGY